MTESYFATCPKGLEGLLFVELQQLGAESVRETVAGVYLSGNSEVLYRACLWSRLANKILLPLETAIVKDEQTLYQAVHAVAWEEHFSADNTLRVDFSGKDKQIRNTQFGALRVKDAIVDRFQQREGQRPSIDKQQPDIIINARLSKQKLHLSLDISGESLHRRGYRYQQGEAPLKENLAAAILIRANWLELAEQSGYLIDPMCGSATLLIEGLMIAADIAPGLMRRDHAWGFTHWQQFDESLWQRLCNEAADRKQKGLTQLRERGFECRGYDRDWRVLQAAQNNIERAGFEEWIRVLTKPIAEFSKPTHKPMNSGLVVSNPPYGERLSEEKALIPVYQQLGEVLRRDFLGWHSAVITSNPSLAKQIGLRARKKYALWNGTIAADLIIFNVEQDAFFKEVATDSPWGANATPDFDSLSEGAKMVCNRLRKNQKQLQKWLNKEAVECYRLYDADIPEYAAAVDVYGEAVHIQEYAAPKSIDEKKAKNRFRELYNAVIVTLQLDADSVYVKQRRRTKGKDQYEKQVEKQTEKQKHKQNDSEKKPLLVVKEGQANLLVDLWSYLDTGLFLDHRPVRRRLATMANGKRFLNLFCYTATATVHSALAGAESSVSVDMSKTYIEWARKNYAKNNINTQRHQLVQADCLTWLQQCREGFDLIFLDPPSFSNSKLMEGVLDIQRDHVQLIQRCMELLTTKGSLVFSNNLRSFVLDERIGQNYQVEDITQQSFDPDFQRNKKLHRCWVIQHQ